MTSKDSVDARDSSEALEPSDSSSFSKLRPSERPSSHAPNAPLLQLKMTVKTVLITGSNRGIGLAFTKHYVTSGWKVIAAVRDPHSATDVRHQVQVRPG